MEKKNIVLLHGALGTTAQLTKLKKLLLPQFNVYSFNFEGHGDNESHLAFSIELFTLNILNFLEENSIQNTSFFGYSMGGYIALNFAKEYPEKVDRLVTLGTKFNWSKAATKLELEKLNPELIEKKVPHFAEKLRKEHFLNDWKDLLNKTASFMNSLSEGKKLEDKDLHEINHPILIGIGSFDNMVSLSESKHAADQLRNGELSVLDGFHHPLEKNDQNVLAETIEKFLLNK